MPRRGISQVEYSNFSKNSFSKNLSLGFYFPLWTGAVLTLLIVSALSYASAIRRYPYFSVPDIDGLQGRQPIQTQRAFNIAHRGSNGEIPEATAEAFLVHIFSLPLWIIHKKILRFFSWDITLSCSSGCLVFLTECWITNCREPLMRGQIL